MENILMPEWVIATAFGVILGLAIYEMAKNILSNILKGIAILIYRIYRKIKYRIEKWKRLEERWYQDSYHRNFRGIKLDEEMQNYRSLSKKERVELLKKNHIRID